MRKKKFLKGIIICGALTIAVTAMAATLLNWEGSRTIVETKEYITASTNKIIAQEKLVNKLKGEKAELERELEEALNNAGTQVPGNGSQTEIDDLKQQIIDKNNEIIELENQIISKQNEVEHLTRELQRANDEISEQQTVLDDAKSKLSATGINLYYTEE